MKINKLLPTKKPTSTSKNEIKTDEIKENISDYYTDFSTVRISKRRLGKNLQELFRFWEDQPKKLIASSVLETECKTESFTESAVEVEERSEISEIEKLNMTISNLTLIENQNQITDNEINEEILNKLDFSASDSDSNEDIININKPSDFCDNGCLKKFYLIYNNKKICKRCFYYIKKESGSKPTSKSTKKTTTRKANCHPDRPLYLKKLCRTCYDDNLLFQKVLKNKKAICHPDRIERSNSLCSICYGKQLMVNKMKSGKKPTCHPNRRLKSKDMCGVCYDKYLYSKREKSVCHPNKLEHKKGICKKCWLARKSKPIVINKQN